MLRLDDETLVANVLRSLMDGTGQAETDGLLENESGFLVKLEDGTRYVVTVTKIEEGE
jgi:hypothetical protein